MSKASTLKMIQKMEEGSKEDYMKLFDELCDRSSPALWEAWCGVTNGPPDLKYCENYHASLARADMFVQIVEDSGLSAQKPYGVLWDMFSKCASEIRASRCPECGHRRMNVQRKR